MRNSTSTIHAVTEQITIRKACPEDVAAVGRILADKEVVGNMVQLPYQSLEKWKEWLRTDDEAVSLIAEIAGEVVGKLDVHPERSRRRSHAASFRLSIHHAHWHEGVASALMTALIDLADNWMNVLRLELHVIASNETAIALYKKFGFVEEGRLRNAVFRSGALVDALCMARLK